jgi:hypothetical protein
MKAVTLRFDPDELQKLKDIKAQGFGSINEVIKCAVLSFASTAPDGTDEPLDPTTASQPKNGKAA